MTPENEDTWFAPDSIWAKAEAQAEAEASQITDQSNDTPETPPEPVKAPVKDIEAPQTEEHAEPDTDADKRIAKLAHKARESAKKAADLQAENLRLRGERQEQPDEQITRLAHEQALAMVEGKRFADITTNIQKAGISEFKIDDWNAAMNAIDNTLGRQGLVQLVEAAHQVGDAHKVLKHLGDNPDILDDIAKLSPVAQGVELAKVHAKLTSKPVKKMSKVTPPVTPISGTETNVNADPDKMTMDEYVAWRASQPKRRTY